MDKPSLIETGVDRLVDLVQAKHKVSFTDAAKELGVSKTVVEEWANFLEEEGIISIEYNFTTPFLTERKLTKKEIQTKSKEFHEKKDTFVRKAESAFNSIEASTNGLEKIRQQFDKLKGELATDVESVRTELEELKNYERLKKGIDEEMLKQRQEFQLKVDEVNTQILQEQKRYQDILDMIEGEKTKIEDERLEAVSIEEQEGKLKENLERLTATIKLLQTKLATDHKSIDIDEGHLEGLKKVSKVIEDEIKGKKILIPHLIEESKRQEEKILQTQAKILDKVSNRQGSLDSSIKHGEQVYDRFKKFFEHKRDIETLLAKITQDKLVLENELQELIKKATAVELSGKSPDVRKHVAEMGEKLENIEKKHSFLSRELERLSGLMEDDETVTQLKDFVLKARGQSLPDEQIRKKLLSSGWANDEIEKAMSS